MTFLENQLFGKKRNRRFRRLPRSSTFWWESVRNNFSDDRFKQTFRLSRSTFTFVLSHIRNKLVKEYVSEESISPEKRLGICLYHLARGDYLYTVTEMVGFAESIPCKGVYIKYVGGGAGGSYKFFKKYFVAQGTIELYISWPTSFFVKNFMTPLINSSSLFKACLR